MKISIIIPCFNEGQRIKKNLIKVLKYIQKNKINAEIIVVDNASVDNTLKKIKEINDKRLKVLHLNEKGKGLAIKKGFDAAKSKKLCFMDADLSTNLNHIKELINELDSFDLVIGNRFHKNSTVKRSLKRKFLSVCYNRFARLVLGISVRDLQCGFKGITQRGYNKIKKNLADNGFFLDTEMVFWAENKKLKINELAVDWNDSDSSSVDINRTASYFVKNLIRLKKESRN